MTLELLVGPSPKIDKIAQGFAYTEGPVFSRIGFLLFSDVRADRIMRWDAGAVKPFREKGNGANGLTFDHQGYSRASRTVSREPKGMEVSRFLQRRSKARA